MFLKSYTQLWRKEINGQSQQNFLNRFSLRHVSANLAIFKQYTYVRNTWQEIINIKYYKKTSSLFLHKIVVISKVML
jgi:hypothetical protein